MKKLKYLIAVISCVYFLMVINGCTKETTPEPLVLVKPIVKTEEQYAALRAYKKSDHAITFGWWGASAGNQTADMSTRYMGLPDSLDLVSLWGGYPGSPEKWAELRYVQKVKGTRFLTVMFASRVDTIRKRNFPTLPILESIDAVAKSISDTVAKYELDGFDLDYEPNYGDGGIFGHGAKDAGGDIYTQRLFTALSKYFGPLSGTGRVLMIDGEIEKGIMSQIDYYAQQAYGSTTFASLQSRYQSFALGLLPTKKFIVTENFQQYGAFGTTFMYNGVNIGSTMGMALWNPTQGRKGGMGGYLIEGDAEGAVPFKNLRKAIQLMNPATK